MKSLLRLVLIAALVVPPFVGSAEAQSIAELRNEAKTAFRSGDYERAVDLYHQLVNHDPGRLNVLKEAMWAYWNMGRIPEAQSMATAVQALSADDVEAKKILGWVPAALNRKKITELHADAKLAYQKGNYEEAANLFAQITSLDPQNVTMLRDRMWILWNMKRIGDATDIADRILRLRPNDTDAQSILNRAPNVAAKLNRNVPASPEKIQELHEKLASDPENATALRQLAWSLFNTGRAAEAEARLKTYLNVNPDNADMWLQLGKIQQGRGDEAAASESFLQSLSIDPNQGQLLANLGKRNFGMRNLDESVKYFERAVALGNNESKELLPILGKSLFYRGEYRRSAEVWGQAVAAFPDKSDYRFHEAEAIFHAGDEGLALAKMRQLKYEYREPQAVAFLIDNAVARNDYSAAAVLLAEDLDKLSIDKGRKVNRLANIYVKLNRLNNAITLLKRWVNFVPRDVWELLTLAGIERDAARYSDAIQTYERVLRINKSVLEAYVGMANAYFGLGDNDKELECLGQALAMEPTNPHMILNYASSLFSNGQRRKGRQMLMDWVKENAKGTMMPILLYHGLTPFDDAPMLGYEIHTTVTSFESQMRSLREADYQSVTMQDVADWHEGKELQAAKPIFIAFDDARMDSFRYSDPILDQYGFQATMFVPLDDVESFGSIGYANWSKMQEYQKTGRWSFQAHGARAHSKITVDSRGRKMLYLVMPQWLADEGRVETEEEWKNRIDEDHRTIKRKLKQNLGTEPIGYAWPEGDFGEHSDSLTAVVNNLTAIKKHFRYAFDQDEFGINVRSQDPYFLHRVEPPKEWSGKELVSHLANKNPLALAYQELIHMAIEEKKFSEANQWLQKLKMSGVTENFYLAESAKINYASGRSSKAYQLALQSFSSDPTPEVQKMLTDFKSRSGIAWRPSVTYQHDNQARESLGTEHELVIPLGLQMKGLGVFARNKYREHDVVEDVFETKLGAGFELGWGDGHELKAVLNQHSVSVHVKDLLGYSASYFAPWSDFFQTRLEARHSFQGGAQAITANIREDNYRASAHYGEKEDWGFHARGRYSKYSDDNERYGSELEAGLPFGKRGLTWGPVYRFTFENTVHVSDFYYSPQDLHIHELGPQFVLAPKSSLKLVVRYLPGYAKEKAVSSRFAQSVDTSLMWQATENVSISPSFYYEETGSYYYDLSEVEMEIRF